jgi:hypothetical protein
MDFSNIQEPGKDESQERPKVNTLKALVKLGISHQLRYLNNILG